MSAFDDKRCILSDGFSPLSHGHYRTVKASIFPDTNHDQDDDNESNVMENNSTSHYEDEDLEDRFFFKNTQPSRSLRDLLFSVTSYKAPDPGRIRVTEIA